MALKFFRHYRWLSQSRWGKIGVSKWSSSQFTLSTISVVTWSLPTLQLLAIISSPCQHHHSRKIMSMMMATLIWTVLHLNINNRLTVRFLTERVAAQEWRFQRRMWLMICVRVSFRGRLAAWQCRRRRQSSWLKTSRPRASICGRRTRSPSTPIIWATQQEVVAIWVKVNL